jgi:hypothetical protein
VGLLTSTHAFGGRLNRAKCSILAVWFCKGGLSYSYLIDLVTGRSARLIPPMNLSKLISRQGKASHALLCGHC